MTALRFSQTEEYAHYGQTSRRWAFENRIAFDWSSVRDDCSRSRFRVEQRRVRPEEQPLDGIRWSVCDARDALQRAISA